MEKLPIERVIEQLEAMQTHRPMYTGYVTAAAAWSFVSGFETACGALGVTFPKNGPENLWDTVERERGWKHKGPTGLIGLMRKKGWSEEAMYNEIFAIHLEVWKRVAVLATRYSEAAEEDRALAEEGMSEYAQGLADEDNA